EEWKSQTETRIRTNRETEDFGFKRQYKDVKILMYLTDWCPICRKARGFFKSLGVTLIEYDVEKDPEKEKERSRKAGGEKGVPVIDIEGKIIVGFGQERI